MSEEEVTPEASSEPAVEPAHWSAGLEGDLADSSLMKRYDSQDAANKAHESLSKSFSGDNVQWPKDASDEAGWAEINKRRGVPSGEEGYGFEPVEGRENASAILEDILKKTSTSKEDAKIIWDGWNEVEQKEMADYTETVEANKAELTKEWGESYDTKVKSALNVIDQFAKDKDHADYLTATLSKDPQGLRFLANMGSQFGEHNVSGFQSKAAMTPAEAQQKITELRNSPDFLSPNDKVRMAVVNQIDKLWQIA